MSSEYGKDMKSDDLTAYLDAALALHGLELDETRKQEVAKQLALLRSMATLVMAKPLAVEVEPANVFRP